MDPQRTFLPSPPLCLAGPSWMDSLFWRILSSVPFLTFKMRLQRTKDQEEEKQSWLLGELSWRRLQGMRWPATLPWRSADSLETCKGGRENREVRKIERESRKATVACAQMPKPLWKAQGRPGRGQPEVPTRHGAGPAARPPCPEGPFSPEQGQRGLGHWGRRAPDTPSWLAGDPPPTTRGDPAPPAKGMRPGHRK